MSAERKRLTLAILLSLLIHAPLLMLTFGGEGFGLPGFGFPWQKRRIEVPDLRVVLMPKRVTPTESVVPPVAEPLQQASVEQPVASGPVPVPSVLSAPSDHPTLILAQTLEAFEPKAEPEAKATTQTEPAPVIVTGAVPAKAPLRTDEATSIIPAAPLAVPSVIAVAPSGMKPAFVMPLPQDAGDAAQKRAEPEVLERAVEVAKPDPLEREAQQERQRQTYQLEAARAEAARQEAERQEAARLATSQQEAQRQEATRIEAERVDAQRRETTRLAVAQQEWQRQEVARREAARLAAAQQDAQRQEVARQTAARAEAARLETERQESGRQAAARQEAARVLEEKEEDARREARRQAMGRQLNEEAAQRESAARPQSTLPYSYSTARRARLWGRLDPNVELVQYAEAWTQRIQFNTSVDTVRDVAKRPHTNPMVAVAIRSDGSVESVTIVVSSGVAEVDEAIRRIVQSVAPNPAFPLGLAREFDVIEVRRTWHFDTAIRIY